MEAILIYHYSSGSFVKLESLRTSGIKCNNIVMSQLIKVAAQKDIAPGSALAVEVAGQKIALFNVEGKLYAIGDTCTHRGGPLSEGTVEGTQVTCPWHKAKFDLQTGSVLNPPAQKPVPSYKVVIDGEDVNVEIP
jgi:nitrite reductase/ring-hydroxylating ferredoxin subunit